MNLFARQEAENLAAVQPLAARMRPQSLEEFVGQSHFLGPGKLLRRMLQADRLQSVIFYGPPGTGKTSLAELIARHTRSRFRRLNAAACGVAELRQELLAARERLASGGERTILFIDEIHRFNKSQQDVLLPEVENGVVRLIGATTANPFFSLVAPLVSRSQVFAFQPLTHAEILTLLRRALADPRRGLGHLPITVTDEALDFFGRVADGDARRALNALEIAVLSQLDDQQPLADKRAIVVDLSVAEECIQQKALAYDADTHYDVASAFIKSIRGSDPDAAIYWLARMLEAGEDPRFIARRLVIAASEDIGNAEPRALLVATAAQHATESIGMPECRIVLAQATTFLACAPKSNAAIRAIDAALQDVRTHAVQPVPAHLRDAHYRGARRLGHGVGYRYAHDAPGGWVDQEYLAVPKQYYQPPERGEERMLGERLREWRARRGAQAAGSSSAESPEAAEDAPGRAADGG